MPTDHAADRTELPFWVDGTLFPAESAFEVTISLLDRGLLLGDGVFETVKVTDRHAYFLTDHLSRLAVSADELGLPIDRRSIRLGIKELLQELPEDWRGSLRITVSRGPGPRGLAPIPVVDQRPRVLMTLGQGAPAPQGTSPQDQLIISSVRRHSSSPAGRMKTLSYGDHLYALREAREQGAADALILNELGRVCGTSMANLFLALEDGSFVTPPLSDGLLPGVVREKLLHRGPGAGIAVKAASIVPEELAGRWCFRTNSLLGVVPCWIELGTRSPGRPAGPPPTALMDSFDLCEREDRGG